MNPKIFSTIVVRIKTIEFFGAIALNTDTYNMSRRTNAFRKNYDRGDVWRE